MTSIGKIRAGILSASCQQHVMWLRELVDRAESAEHNFAVERRALREAEVKLRQRVGIRKELPS